VRPHTQQRETLLQLNFVCLCAQNVSATCVLYLVVACLPLFLLICVCFVAYKAHVHQKDIANNERKIDEQLGIFFRLLKYVFFSIIVKRKKIMWANVNIIANQFVGNDERERKKIKGWMCLCC